MRTLAFFVVAVALAGAATLNPYQNVQTPSRVKEHSKLKGDYSGTGVYIPDLLTKGGRDVTIVKHHAAGYTGQPANVPSYPPYELVANGCTADAVVVGTVGSQSSEVTEDGHFLFTDLQLQVGDILKNNATAPIAVGDSITVTRPGGSIKAHGRTIHAVDPGFKAFSTSEKYLLYLQYIPATGAYRATAESSYEITGNRIVPVSHSSAVAATTPETLLEAARAALVSTCGGSQ